MQAAPPLDLATPLHAATFVVLDLETTGGAPAHDRITEVGALKVRGGEVLGRFETLVNPGLPIPPTITVLTGITEAMVSPAPDVGAVLPALLEFVGGAVIVGHNVRFDCAFLDAALAEHGYQRLTNRRVDTLRLARRLLADDVDNLRLQTLAAHLRAATAPAHRAYADAAATTDVFHALLERASAYGVFGLDDLFGFPKVRLHPSTAKLRLTARLPRAPGIFAFRDRAGRVIHVGRAADIRARVRGYFSGNASSVVDLRAVPQLLRETAAIDHRVCAGALEAAVRELRLVERLRPRFNRRSGGRTPWYLKLTRGPTRRLRVVRSLRDSDDVALGPFRTPDAARFVRDAIAPLPPDVVRRGCDGEPAVVLDAVRDRAGWHAVAAALRTRQTVRTLRETPRLRFDSAEGRIEIRHGSLVLHDDDRSAPDDQELILVAQWLARPSSRARLLDVDGVCASALPGAPPYDAGRERSRGGRADVCSGSIE